MSTELALSKEAILGTEEDAGEGMRWEDPVEIARQIVQRILEAPDIDAVLEQLNVEHARDVLGQVFVLSNARFQRSRFAGTEGATGPSLYALLDLEDKKGLPHTVTCGGRNVLAQLYRMLELGALPVQIRFVEGSETSNGYKPLWLERA